MNFIPAILAILAASALNAETVGNVEFHLPQEPMKWTQAGDQMKKGKTTTILYAPEFTQLTSNEYFGVDLLEFPFGFPDEKTLSDAVSKQFPGKDVNVKILDRDGVGVLYEWDVADNGKEVLHGWNRSLQTGKGDSVLLMYMFRPGQKDEIAKKSEIWLPILRNAKSVNEKVKDK